MAAGVPGNGGAGPLPTFNVEETRLESLSSFMQVEGEEERPRSPGTNSQVRGNISSFNSGARFDIKVTIEDRPKIICNSKNYS